MTRRAAIDKKIADNADKMVALIAEGVIFNTRSISLAVSILNAAKAKGLDAHMLADTTLTSMFAVALKTTPMGDWWKEMQ
jgi:hypothetical protein